MSLAESSGHWALIDAHEAGAVLPEPRGLSPAGIPPPRVSQPFATALPTLGDSVTRFGRLHGLSGRETEVLLQAVQGRHNKAIADEIGIALATVDTFWARIRRKVACSSQAEVMAKLLREIFGER